MSTYVPAKKSQIYHYIETPLYIKNKKGDYILYKSESTPIDAKRFSKDDSPQLFIAEKMREAAYKELQGHLKEKLLERIDSGDLKSIKLALCDIVQEAMQEPLDENLQALPETIDIIYTEYDNISKILKNIGDFRFGGTTLVEHSVNVMVMVMNYCIFNNLPEEDTRRLGLGALLHDVGLTRIPKKITSADRRLTDQEFSTYKTHPSLGHDIIIENKHIDSTVAVGALEHHERLDGKGYPRGISSVSFEGSLIGIIDCFDNLTNTERKHRKMEDSFGSMKRIQAEILEKGKFDKAIFIDLCLSLLGKSKFG